jgi:adenylate cyclase
VVDPLEPSALAVPGPPAPPQPSPELLDELVELVPATARCRTTDDDLRDMLRYILASGVTVDALRDAVLGGDPRQALVEHRILGAVNRYSVEEAAARTGLHHSRVVEVLRACGLPVPEPGQRGIPATDLAAIELFGRVDSFFGAETVLRFSRVMSQSVSRVAEAAISMFGMNVEDPLLARGGSQTELTKAADVALTAIPVIPELFRVLFAHHALDASRRLGGARTDPTTHDTVTVAVGFADLVRSTEWTAALTPRELAEALGEFERLGDAARVGTARIVKTIGDELMFTAVDPVDACRTGLAIAGALAEEQRLPDLRVGIAYGPVVALDGDFYGSVVNLASRLVEQATPGRVVVDPATVAAVTPTLQFEPLPAREVAGFDQPVTPSLIVPA